MSRRDLPWLGLVALSLVVGLASGWYSFGDLLVDCGREMNQPVRLLRGERLYADVQHLYGPLAPHLNAVLLRLSGVHLDVLRAAGAGATVLIVALVYRLTRRLCGRRGAATAAFAVTWLCAFAPAGNFVLPYSYSAVYGSALVLASAAFAVGFLERRRPAPLALSGLCAGLACLTKLELGAAALAGGVTAAILFGALRVGPALRRLLAFSVPALAVPSVVYGILVARLGKDVLRSESALLLHLPPPMLFFLRRQCGFERPWLALFWEVLVAGALAGLAGAIALVALGLARPGPPGLRRSALRYGPWLPVAAALLCWHWMPPWFDAMGGLPLIAAAVLLVSLPRALRQWRMRARVAPRQAVVLVYAVLAFACLGRTVLSVRTNSYGTFLLPAALVVLTYVSTWWLPARLRRPSAVRWAARLGTAAMLGWAVTNGAIAAQRAAARAVYPVATRRGTMLAGIGHGTAFAAAIRFLERETRPGDAVAVLPEGTSLLFLTDRRNPLNEEEAVTGLFNEPRAIARLEASGTRVILLTNRPTHEYGLRAFGQDYDRRTAEWIESHFHVCGAFGRAAMPDREIGSGRFFIKAYCRD
ncbi:MAG TPA: glycosyltransferase family 39 protein [Vicinamibacteria bacterium]|nr:glycosyltransferase family 39 protein [Vicinamibacteria bacterium]